MSILLLTKVIVLLSVGGGVRSWQHANCYSEWSRAHSVIAVCLATASFYCTLPAQAADSSIYIESRPPPVTTRQKIIRSTENVLTNPVLENIR